MADNFWAEPPIAIAHRGGDAAGADQENTLKAFKEAEKLGYAYGETDVILAASGEVVVIHGSRNRLQASIKGDYSRTQLERMTLNQIRKEYRTAGIPVPTLEELLNEFPKMKFFIDPKTDRVTLPLAKLLQKMEAVDRVCVGSFDYDRVRQFMKLVGEACSTSFIIGRGLRVVNKSLLMLKSDRIEGMEAVQMHHSLVSREMIDLVHKRGFKALVWTCNSPLSIKNAINCGADGIISDNAELLLSMLQTKEKSGRKP